MIPSDSAAVRSGVITPRRSASSALGERHGGELYSSCPPGSKVRSPPSGSRKQGAPLAVRSSVQPCRAPQRRRNGSRARGASSSGHRRPVSNSTGMSSASAPMRRSAVPAAAKAWRSRSPSSADRRPPFTPAFPPRARTAPPGRFARARDGALPRRKARRRWRGRACS